MASLAASPLPTARAPPPPSKNTKAAAATVSPEAYSSLSSRMQVNKNIVDELLLVCGVIGTTEGDQFVPVTDCLNWLQDLQRALRRDDDLYRPISVLLGQWKVVSQKLLPLVMTCRYDTPLVLTVCKILVILTKPLADNTVRAAQMVIETKKTKNSPPE
jgi:timeless